MPHCPACSHTGDHKSVMRHMEQRGHKGEVCEGEYQRVLDAPSKDDQWACFRCSRYIVKAGAW